MIQKPLLAITNMSARIMIVDDDPVNNMICEKILQLKGVSEENISFTDGINAINYLKDIKGQYPGAILLDLNLPILDGWSFMDEMIALGINIPTFILTSSIDPVDKEKSNLYNQVKGFFSKPLADHNLREIKSWLRNSA